MRRIREKWDMVEMVILFALFYFIFLGSEYFFDNSMMHVTDSDHVVLAQSYILGINVIGFILFSPVSELMGRFWSVLGTSMAVPAAIGIYVIWQKQSYAAILCGGLFLFLLLGFLGGWVHYLCVSLCKRSERLFTELTKVVGIAYASGILLQFLNNNCVSSEVVESLLLIAALGIMTWMCFRMEKKCPAVSKVKTESTPEKETYQNNRKRGWKLIGIVIVMTFVFATLDNAVTLVHAQGSVDIGQWPRLLLACSGLCAGFLFGWKKGTYMNFIMYSIMVLSTICIIVLSCGGPFLAGLFVFYLSAGFFSVYFTTVFMNLAPKMRQPRLWAGLGRALNNLCAVIIASLSIYLLKSPSYVIISIALFLCVIASILVFWYQLAVENERLEAKEKEKMQQFQEMQEKMQEMMRDNKETPQTVSAMQCFAEEFQLTQREKEVLEGLLSSDSSVQELAKELALSRTALYRHIAAMNEKTSTKTRIGLIQFYYGWLEKH